MKSIFFKQSKPFTVTILGSTLLGLAILLAYEGRASLGQIAIMIFLALILLAYSISYEIVDNLEHKKHFRFLGITFFKRKLDVGFPDYIVVFYALFNSRTEWGPVSAMGKKIKEGEYVIRFLKENKYFTIWKSSSLEKVRTRAIKVGSLLNAEVKFKNCYVFHVEHSLGFH